MPCFVSPDRSTNYLYLNPSDAEKPNLRGNNIAEVSAPYCRVKIPVRITDDLMPGVVTFPHGWGHKDAEVLTIARKNLGVNVNYLTPDGPDGYENLSGMSHITAIVVDVQ